MTFGVFRLMCKIYESASSCDFPTIAGPIPMNKRPIRGAREVLNQRKRVRRLKKISLKIGN